jgi:hypothetical protein
LGESFRVLAHVGWERFLGIAAALADADDSGCGVTFENSAIFGEGELARGDLCRLPIGIVGAALDVVNHLAVELEGNAQLDEGFRVPLLGRDAVSRRGDHG